jgi:hypothetical protein
MRMRKKPYVFKHFGKVNAYTFVTIYRSPFESFEIPKSKKLKPPIIHCLYTVHCLRVDAHTYIQKYVSVNLKHMSRKHVQCNNTYTRKYMWAFTTADNTSLDHEKQPELRFWMFSWEILRHGCVNGKVKSMVCREDLIYSYLPPQHVPVWGTAVSQPMRLTCPNK